MSAKKRKSQTKIRNLIAIKLILLFAFSCLLTSCSEKTNLEAESYFFTAYGRLFKIDPKKRRINLLYTFHPEAPSIARSPQGHIWARVGEKGLAAFDPQSGEVKDTVELPLRPYNHIIAPNGKAYVTHPMIEEEFSISIVDTYKKELLGQIKNIYGLRTDLTYGDGFVYLATTGVDRPDSLFLYQIDISTDKIKFLYGVPITNYYWRVSVYADSLYLCQVTKPNRPSVPRIEVMDLSKKIIHRTITSSSLPGIGRILSKITFRGDRAYLPCQTTEGSYAIAVLDPHSKKVLKVLPVAGQIYRIIDIKKHILMYIDNPVAVGMQGVSLYFYHLKQEKEVKVINIAQFLQESQI
ncbi:MAG: hypothetical protein AMJ90_01520 [candidate division Zixibacteria bacterium SM23_73_2]|nr:MAG: hypothetical protein AMJ90_01520 [candidate division Zixibacteria bacterium SM23_73_2]